MNELVAQNTELAHDIGSTDEISWTAPSDLTMEQYLSIANTFQRIQRSLGWWYGDLLVEGERLFGEASAQAIPEIGRGVETLLKYQAVSVRIRREIRQPQLSWTHHFYCAYIDEDQRGDLLTLALNMGLSSRELKEITKLDYFLREDLITASKRDMTHEEFMALANRLKLQQVGKPPQKEGEDSKADNDDDLPFSGMDDEGAVEEDETTGINYEAVQDFWENAGVPLKFCGVNEAIWEGLLVRPALDSQNRLVLVWEEVP